MLLIVRTKVDAESLKHVAEDLKGYIKVVVDVRRGILIINRLKRFRIYKESRVPGTEC